MENVFSIFTFFLSYELLYFRTKVFHSLVYFWQTVLKHLSLSSEILTSCASFRAMLSCHMQ